MTNATPQVRRIQLLLNVLLHERFLRRPLLAEIIDESERAGQQTVALGARALLARLGEGIEQDEYRRCVTMLLELTNREATYGACQEEVRV